MWNTNLGGGKHKLGKKKIIMKEGTQKESLLLHYEIAIDILQKIHKTFTSKMYRHNLLKFLHKESEIAK